jgi:hypothetical protein
MAVAERTHTALGTELATFDRHRAELVAASEGKYVLIRGDEIAGVYESQMDAIQEGYRRFGREHRRSRNVRLEFARHLTLGHVHTGPGEPPRDRACRSRADLRQ